ncbi:MAG TPA: hypothetical protein VHG10_02760 [Glycomyces sp.]|nr:hypothetical protein [Glycomyces sp.]
MVRQRWALLVIAGLLTGCTATGPQPEVSASAHAKGSESEAPQPDAAVVAWLDEFCGTYWDHLLLLSWPHDLETPEAPTDADRQPLIDVLEDLIAQLDTIDPAITALEPAPDESTATVLDLYRASYDGLRAQFTEHAESATWYPLEELPTLYRLNALTLAGFLPIDGKGLDILADYEDLAAASSHAANC